MYNNMFNKEDNTDITEMKSNVQEFDDCRIDLTLSIQKPSHFDELKKLIDCYEDMEIIINSLKRVQVNYKLTKILMIKEQNFIH